MNLFLGSASEQSKNFIPSLTGCIPVCTAQLAHRPGFGYLAAMFTVLIETHDDEEALARTLASLVPGAVEGVIREVIVRDAGSTDGTAAVADHAGCRRIAADDYRLALRQAKGDWLMLLRPGARMGEGWIEAMTAHVSTSTGAARFRVDGGWSRLFSRCPPLEAGLLITRREAIALADRAEGSAALARAASPKRLNAAILPPGA